MQREDVYKHFKWTRRTTRTGLIGMVLVPAAVYTLCAVTDVCFSSYFPMSRSHFSYMNRVNTIGEESAKENHSLSINRRNALFYVILISFCTIQ